MAQNVHQLITAQILKALDRLILATSRWESRWWLTGARLRLPAGTRARRQA